MANKSNPKKENFLKKAIGAVTRKNAETRKRETSSYARKPSSNIQRRKTKTTLKKIEKALDASRQKRSAKTSESKTETSSPIVVPATPQAETNGSGIVAHKFDIEPHRQPPPTSQFENLGELPEAYNTGTLFLVARDPHWLFAYWDFTWHKMQEFRNQASDHTVRLRIFGGRGEPNQLEQDIVLHPDSKNWFVHVGQARKKFRAELGFYSHGHFHVISRSRTVTTPADDLSQNTAFKFATLPFHIKFHELVEFVKGHFRPGDELMDVLYRLQAQGFRLPFEYERDGQWGEGDEKMLLQLFGEDLFRRIRMGSFEISEWLRKRFREEALGGISSWSSPTSPFGASWQKQYRAFWLNVNAEVILYGETDPNAKVCVDGKEIKLRPDGTFRFHFALPDGKFHLPITAESSDKVEKRSVVVDFGRATRKQGEVGKAKSNKELPEPIQA